LPIIVVRVNADGRREVLSMDIGHSEAEPYMGLRGVKLVISGSEGIKAAFAKR
jgi:hypothetical protein